MNRSQLDESTSSGSVALNGSRRSSKAVAENKGVDASFDSTAPDQPTGAFYFLFLDSVVACGNYPLGLFFGKYKMNALVYDVPSGKCVPTRDNYTDNGITV